MDAVDWRLLAKAIEFYEAKGYAYVEAPWAVSAESVGITCPNPQYAATVDALGSLVGSAEQSFLHLDLAGELPKGRFVALTPCFRLGDLEDHLHYPYFMKVELYANEDHASAWRDMRHHAHTFFSIQLKSAESDYLHSVQTREGFDLELNGIELGSYGMRHHEGHCWAYGTGLAEPRFSMARRLLPVT